MAHAANNPADIAIHDGQGHVADVLQLEATESRLCQEAIAAHPDIDVVVPHDLCRRLADHPELLGHIVDDHQTLGDLMIMFRMRRARGWSWERFHFPGSPRTTARPSFCRCLHRRRKKPTLVTATRLALGWWPFWLNYSADYGQ
jgi:hypothetical protein